MASPGQRPLSAASGARRNPRGPAGASIVDAVITAARELLVSEGYRGLKMNAVARRAGVSVGSLYHYFPDKHAVCAAIAARTGEVRRELATELDASRDGARSTVERWLALLFSPRLGSLELRRTLLLEVPASWVDGPESKTDAILIDRFANALTSASFRSGPVPLMAFVSYHAAKAVVEAVICERPEDIASLVFHRELLRLVSAYVGVPQYPEVMPGWDVPSHPLPSPEPTKPALPAGKDRETRRRLLEAAEALLRAEGFDGLTMAALARRAGLGRNTAYRYFQNAESVLVALAAHRREFVIAGAGRALFQVGASLKEACGDLGEELCADMRDDASSRRALLRHVPRAWSEAGTFLTNMETLGSAALRDRREEIRDGDVGWMVFVVVRALRGVLEAALLQRPELLDGPVAGELAELAYRYVARESAVPCPPEAGPR